MQWELIAPLDDESVYAHFLAEKGRGVYHIGVDTPSIDEAVAAEEKRGNKIVRSRAFRARGT